MTTISPESQAILDGMRESLQPDDRSQFLPLTGSATEGTVEWAVPQFVRNLGLGALDLFEGPQTGVVTPAATRTLMAFPSGGPGVLSSGGVGRSLIPKAGTKAKRSKAPGFDFATRGGARIAPMLHGTKTTLIPNIIEEGLKQGFSAELSIPGSSLTRLTEPNVSEGFTGLVEGQEENILTVRLPKELFEQVINASPGEYALNDQLKRQVTSSASLPQSYYHEFEWFLGADVREAADVRLPTKEESARNKKIMAELDKAQRNMNRARGALASIAAQNRQMGMTARELAEMALPASVIKQMLRYINVPSRAARSQAWKDITGAFSVINTMIRVETQQGGIVGPGRAGQQGADARDILRATWDNVFAGGGARINPDGPRLVQDAWQTLQSTIQNNLDRMTALGGPLGQADIREAKAQINKAYRHYVRSREQMYFELQQAADGAALQTITRSARQDLRRLVTEGPESERPLKRSGASSESWADPHAAQSGAPTGTMIEVAMNSQGMLTFEDLAMDLLDLKPETQPESMYMEEGGAIQYKHLTSKQKDQIGKAILDAWDNQPPHLHDETIYNAMINKILGLDTTSDELATQEQSVWDETI